MFSARRRVTCLLGAHLRGVLCYILEVSCCPFFSRFLAEWVNHGQCLGEKVSPEEAIIGSTEGGETRCALAQQVKLLTSWLETVQARFPPDLKVQEQCSLWEATSPGQFWMGGRADAPAPLQSTRGDPYQERWRGEGTLTELSRACSAGWIPVCGGLQAEP